MGYAKNGTMLQCFEWYLPCDGSLWRRIAEDAGKLADAGLTSLWLPPATKGAFGDQGVGYAVYDLYDLGEFDQKGSVATKYGHVRNTLKR
jgi:alpha-amylase